MIYRIFRTLWLGPCFLIVACSGGGGGTDPVLGPNEVAVIIDSGPTGSSINMPFTTVTVCAPGGSSCRTIDHVLVDTGSAGLRIVGSKIDSSVLPAESDANGDPVMECTQFADGDAWGSIKLADVRIANEEASAVPIQVIGDPNAPAVPDNCSQAGNGLNSVAAFGSNGVLGVEGFDQDCGPTCALSPSSGSYTPFYYGCPTSTSCASIAQPLDQQVQNPVGHFTTDNNGIMLELSPILGIGAPSLGGKLVFGIGTQSNNAVGNPHILAIDPATSRTATTYGGLQKISYVDSGSNALFFVDSSIPACGDNDVASGFYCPNTKTLKSASVELDDGSQTIINFTVDNADNLLFSDPRFTVFSTLAGPGFLPADRFVWGLPFFIGKTVIFALPDKFTPLGTGPLIAYQ
ncbi:MAG TPA: DUF3443 family protein [Aggregatilineales bacterium]|nr:DUF3443 family protein [Aggregatilineales bacterium]